MTTNIAGNVERVKERVESACQRAGRSVEEVTIVAVTKTRGADLVDAVIDAGIADVAENRIQEFLEKRGDVTRPCRWHLVGTLQSNKATKAIGQFELVHSVDRMRIAGALSRLGAERALTTRILVEVNTSGEATKHGFAPEEVVGEAAAIAELPGLHLDGLMTIGPLTSDAGTIRRSFQTLYRLRDRARASTGLPLPHLSMGMSDDFEMAIEEGATIIRVGTVLFGPRGY